MLFINCITTLAKPEYVSSLSAKIEMQLENIWPYEPTLNFLLFNISEEY